MVGDVKSSLRTIVKILSKETAKKADRQPLAQAQKGTDTVLRRDHQGLSKRDYCKKVIEATCVSYLPAEAIVTTEVGQCQMWASLHFDVISPGTFFSSTGLGTMGFGFPSFDRRQGRAAKSARGRYSRRRLV